MYTGWWPSLRFRINRPLDDDEKRLNLTRKANESEFFDDHNGLVALNSTYIEWVDRRFRARGAGATSAGLISIVFFMVVTAFLLVMAFLWRNDSKWFYTFLESSTFGPVAAAIMYYVRPRLDFFKKTYYPIRFNRKNRMVYVYRDKKDGGILSVPWDKVFFHIGRGMQNPVFCDIRGEVLEGNIVKDTFALGPYMPGPQGIYQMWAFIRRYMEDGPEAVGPDPRDRYINLSLHGSLKDCALVVYTNFGAPNLVLRIISLPFIAASTITRWLVFKTCSMPQWPAEIEAACAVEPGDPNIWPQPKYMNQFIVENPDIRQRAMDRLRGATAPTTSLADDIGAWQREMESKK